MHVQVKYKISKRGSFRKCDSVVYVCLCVASSTDKSRHVCAVYQSLDEIQSRGKKREWKFPECKIE